MTGTNERLALTLCSLTGKNWKLLAFSSQRVHLPTGRAALSVVIPITLYSISSGALSISPRIKVSIPPGMDPHGSAGWAIQTRTFFELNRLRPLTGDGLVIRLFQRSESFSVLAPSRIHAPVNATATFRPQIHYVGVTAPIGCNPPVYNTVAPAY
jgi:hypothetical protein